MKKEYLFAFVACFMLLSCSQKKVQPELTPWGTPVGESEVSEEPASASSSKGLSLDDIVAGGELIMLTVNGPTTYYDYHNHGMGLQYLLCEKFAQQIGVSLRVEECKDTTEMIQKLQKGEGDIIAVPLPRHIFKGEKSSAGKNNTAAKSVSGDSKTINLLF